MRHRGGKQTDLHQEYRKRPVPRILRTCRFNRGREIDLIGTATSYKKRYFEIRDIVEGVCCEYEPHADELDEAVHDIERESGLQNVWNELAPLNEHQEAIDEDLQMDNYAAEPYDIGQDLDLPAQVMPDNFQPITMRPDE